MVMALSSWGRLFEGNGVVPIFNAWMCNAQSHENDETEFGAYQKQIVVRLDAKYALYEWY